jgi:hypothetical protein
MKCCFLFVWRLQSSKFELTAIVFLILYLWRKKNLLIKEKDVYEQLYVYSYCLFVFKPVFCFIPYPIYCCIIQTTPLYTINWWKKINLAGQKIRQLNFDLSKLSSNDYWIFGHWIDWLKKMRKSSFKKLNFYPNFRLFCQGW